MYATAMFYATYHDRLEHLLVQLVEPLIHRLTTLQERIVLRFPVYEV